MKLNESTQAIGGITLGAAILATLINTGHEVEQNQEPTVSDIVADKNLSCIQAISRINQMESQAISNTHNNPVEASQTQRICNIQVGFLQFEELSMADYELINRQFYYGGRRVFILDDLENKAGETIQRSTFTECSNIRTNIGISTTTQTDLIELTEARQTILAQDRCRAIEENTDSETDNQTDEPQSFKDRVYESIGDLFPY